MMLLSLSFLTEFKRIGLKHKAVNDLRLSSGTKYLFHVTSVEATEIFFFYLHQR